MANTQDNVMIRMEDIHKSYGDVEVLKGIDIEVHRGEVLAIIGPSGSGKSTLLRCINRLEDITSGLVEIEGGTLASTKGDGTVEYAKEEDSRKLLGCMGMVFQQFNLFPHMTVLENLLEAPVHVKKRAKEAVLPEAMALLKKVGLEDRADYYPAQLSGGQQQRVAIARALCMKPDIMLFDEPTSALDPELTGEVLRRARGREPCHLHGRRRHRRAGRAAGVFRAPKRGTHKGVPQEYVVTFEQAPLQRGDGPRERRGESPARRINQQIASSAGAISSVSDFMIFTCGTSSKALAGVVPVVTAAKATPAFFAAPASTRLSPV